MSVDNIVNYVMNSPQNTNKMVLKGLIESEVSENSPKKINLDKYNMGAGTISDAIGMLFNLGGGSYNFDGLEAKGFFNEIKTHRIIEVGFTAVTGDYVTTQTVTKTITGERWALTFLCILKPGEDVMTISCCMHGNGENIQNVTVLINSQKPTDRTG